MRARRGGETAQRAKFGAPMTIGPTIGELKATRRREGGNNHGRCSRLAIGSLVTGPESLINRDYGGGGACERAPCARRLRCRTQHHTTTSHTVSHATVGAQSNVAAPDRRAKLAQACVHECLFGREIITSGCLTRMKSPSLIPIGSVVFDPHPEEERERGRRPLLACKCCAAYNVILIS